MFKYNSILENAENDFDNFFSSVDDKVTLPMNIIHEEDGSSTIEVAVVGKTREDVKVKGITENGKVFLVIESVDKEQTEDEKKAEEKRVYTLRKIKGTGKLSVKIFVPANLDMRKSVVKVENGLLTVKIPVAEEAKPVEFEIA